MTVAERFWSKVNKTETCWLWCGTTPNGYGQFHVDARKIPAHRWAYEQAKGPIANGLHLDHLCRVTRCVNPDHLEAVTPRENIMRGEGLAPKRKRQTHCKYGHEFTQENTRPHPYYPQNRQCKTCENRRPPEVHAAKRAKKMAAGKCVVCSDPIGPISKIKCDSCAIRHRAVNAAYEQRRGKRVR